MNPSGIQYRLKSRNVIWGEKKSNNTVPAPTPVPEKRPIAVTGADVLRLHRLLLELQQPTIFEQLPFLKPSDLNPWIRTCPWAWLPKHRGPIISQPFALSEYLNTYVLGEDDVPCRDNTDIRFIRATVRDLKSLSTVLASGGDPHLTTALGLILALSLFEHFKWGRENRKATLKLAHQDPMLAYYYVSAVTPSRDEWEKLQPCLCLNPRAALYALRLPHFSGDINVQTRLHLTALSDPLYAFLFSNFNGRCTEIEMEKLIKAEHADASGALIAFSLAPHYQSANAWLETILPCPEYPYRREARRSFLRELSMFLKACSNMAGRLYQLTCH